MSLLLWSVADLHGNLFDIDKSRLVDLAIIAGDICPDIEPVKQVGWLNTKFHDWCDTILADKIIVIGGNHDFGIAEFKTNINWHSKVIYLCNDIATYKNYRIWGLPYTPKCGSWAFMESEEMLLDMYNKLVRYYKMVCGDIDIFVAHGPPYGILDIGYGGNHAGSTSLLNLIDTVRPKLTVCGHLHDNNGIEYIQYHDKRDGYYLNKGLVANVSALDNAYKLVNRGIYIEVE